MAIVKASAGTRAFLAAAMLAFGTVNTISTKMTDNFCFAKCDGPVADKVTFNHPVFQTFTMFIGESLCLLAFIFLMFRARSDYKAGKLASPPKIAGFSPFWFALPTMCDMSGTTLMNVGLILTSASVYQMLRGALVILTAALSVVFLKRKLYKFHYFGIVLVTIGITIVGVTSVIMNKEAGADHQAKSPLLGNILVIIAQFFAAVQFVVEEKLMEKFKAHPLQAVGYEGIFGMMGTGIALAITAFTLGTPGNSGYDEQFDVALAIKRTFSNAGVGIPILASICSIACFNFVGLRVTQTMSSASRSTIDTCRTLFIWAISLLLGWEAFNPYEVIGFVVLVYGTMVYNSVLPLPMIDYSTPEYEIESDWLRAFGNKNQGENLPLLTNKEEDTSVNA